MLTVYQQLKPDTNVIEHYHRDFTYHDLQSFRQAKNGDVAIWSAGRCGTHLAFTHREGKPVDSDHVSAVVAVYGHNPVWRRIEFTGANAGRIVRLTQPPSA